VLRRHAADVLVDEHLATWIGPWLHRVGELGAVAYRRWSQILDETLAERAPPPRTASTIADEIEPVRHLLAAGRSGVIITRKDLKRCAAELGLGARIGERAYTLKALLDQDTERVVAWLGDMVGEWIDRAPLPPDWNRRASDTLVWLNSGRLSAKPS
jgi:hypothetical protein